MPVTHADLKTVVEFKHIRKMGISYIKSSKSRSPRRAGGILAQGRSLVNRASSLSSSRCQGLHCPGEPAAIWPNLRAWSTGPPHLPLQSASSPRWQSFEEVRFFRVSFHSFRQKRDSPSEWVKLSRVRKMWLSGKLQFIIIWLSEILLVDCEYLRILTIHNYDCQEYFLVDQKTRKIHNPHHFVRDFYFFKRSNKMLYTIQYNTKLLLYFTTILYYTIRY